MSGVIFTRAGARLGRDLLLAHQHLLRAGDLLSRLVQPRGESPCGPAAEGLFAELQSLLAKTSELSARSDGLLARER